MYIRGDTANSERKRRQAMNLKTAGSSLWAWLTLGLPVLLQEAVLSAGD